MKQTLFFRHLALTGHLGTMILVTTWNAWIIPPERIPIALVLIILLTPLLLVFRGILNENRRSHAWLSLIALFYFTLGIGDAYSDPQDRIYGVILILTSLMMFIGSVAYLKTSASSTEIIEAEDKT